MDTRLAPAYVDSRAADAKIEATLRFFEVFTDNAVKATDAKVRAGFAYGLLVGGVFVGSLVASLFTLFGTRL